jgi:2'-5' RNA ligase
MQRKRLFIAIDLPAENSREIYKICENIKGIRWTKKEQLHLTLYFIGNTDVEIIPQLSEKLSALKFPSFELTVSGTGFFRSNIFFLELDDSEILNCLKAQIDSVVSKILGIEPSPCDFVPHITIARFKHRLSFKKSDSLEQKFEKILPQKFTVNKFTLYESKTYPNGAVHTPLAEFYS